MVVITYKTLAAGQAEAGGSHVGLQVINFCQANAGADLGGVCGGCNPPQNIPSQKIIFNF